MLRNKEFRWLLYMNIIAIALVASASHILKLNSVVSVIVIGVFLMLSFIWITSKRYNDIKRLSHDLKSMMEGRATFDIRSNEEGELSILKNELYKLTSRLNEQHDYLQGDRARMAEALADVSHQLKTPITAIQMIVDFLEDESLPLERRTQFMNQMQGQINRMDWLVKVLLKLSKLDAGTVQFMKQEIKLEGLVKQAIKGVELTINHKHIHLTLPKHDSPLVNVDEKWMIESIFNVINNAVEHTPHEGSVVIDWQDNPVCTSLVIQNSGSVIEKTDLIHVFKRFYKGKYASDSSVGIGLSLSLQIMEAHHGTIEVDSSVEKGTCFTFKWYKRK